MNSRQVDAKHPEDVKASGEFEGEVSHVDKLDKLDDRIANYDDSIENTKISTAVWLITFTVATGGFLFGQWPSITPLKKPRLTNRPNQATIRASFRQY